MSPVELIGAALVLASVLLFLLEVKAPGFGVFGVSGAVALAAGLVLAFGLTSAALPVAAAVAIPVALLFIFLAVLAHRARAGKVVTGEAGMVGLEGRAETALAPDGKVFVRGELWDAWSSLALERGSPVRVVGVRGLRLEVTSTEPNRLPALSAVIDDANRAAQREPTQWN